MAQQDVAVLVSGGLDSDVLLAETLGRARRVYPIYVRQGLAWEKVEVYWLKRFLHAVRTPRLAPPTVLDLTMRDVYGAHWSVGKGAVPGARTPDEAVYLPGRNLILTVKAAVFCALRKIPQLSLGSLGHNPFPDATPGFFKAWAKALSQGLRFSISVRAPYRQRSKAEVIRRGKSWPLELSFSCIRPRGRRHCGRCNKCAERRRAFRAAGVKDRTRYA